jgi:hypothetical protein
MPCGPSPGKRLPGAPIEAFQACRIPTAGAGGGARRALRRYPLTLRPQVLGAARRGASAAVTPVAEFLDESWAGWRPIELGSSLGRGGALIEQEDFGEVIA